MIMEKVNVRPVGRSSLISPNGKQLLLGDTTNIKDRKCIRSISNTALKM